ncbi:hypothetical protein HDU93_006623 [Gonapodya sp. JEL0774]|nr:hypothetical protein HDU93_006623 [Gonapodya sp. JEL0774]
MDIDLRDQASRLRSLILLPDELRDIAAERLVQAAGFSTSTLYNQTALELIQAFCTAVDESIEELADWATFSVMVPMAS